MFLSSLNTNFPPSPSYPSIYSLHSCFEIKLFTWSRGEGCWQVKGDYLFLFPQAETACSLWWSFTTCMHYTFSVFTHLSDFIWFSLNLLFVTITYLISDLGFSCFIFISSGFFLFSFSLLFLLPSPSPSCPTDQVAVVGHSGARAIS